MFSLIFTAVSANSPIASLTAEAAYHFSNFRAHPPIHQYGGISTTPKGLSPAQIKKIYNLPKNGGQGTVAIIGAYDSKTIEKDLNIFSKQFSLPKCTTANNCFEKHLMENNTKSNSGWSLETSLDVEWAHAIAPQAKILLVEAKTPSGVNLLKAIDYTRARPDVVAISMSWGGDEFPEETTLDSHFTSDYDITFFASSGDNGTGASWPAASPNVVAVGGTTITLDQNKNFKSETAWTGSGGGVSAYEKEPTYQANYNITHNKKMRGIPDVSYDADPASGFAVYRNKGWYVIGGTSAGAPQWAAIKSLSLSADNSKFYAAKASTKASAYFRDIRSGSNGVCKYFCDARKHYDYVTGLGSPLTSVFK
ncbi:S53 family peptidase [Candidatus Peregrinibacteria bacterium]|nr:S53 family peptidase [Candidatus Peregrinibacteria bacterium]